MDENTEAQRRTRIKPISVWPQNPFSETVQGRYVLKVSIFQEETTAGPRGVCNIRTHPAVSQASDVWESKSNDHLFILQKHSEQRWHRVSIILQLTILWEKQTSRFEAEALVRVTSGVCLWRWWWGGYQKSLPKAVTLREPWRRQRNRVLGSWWAFQVESKRYCVTLNKFWVPGHGSKNSIWWREDTVGRDMVWEEVREKASSQVIAIRENFSPHGFLFLSL